MNRTFQFDCQQRSITFKDLSGQVIKYQMNGRYWWYWLSLAICQRLAKEDSNFKFWPGMPFDMWVPPLRRSLDGIPDDEIQIGAVGKDSFRQYWYGLWSGKSEKSGKDRCYTLIDLVTVDGKQIDLSELGSHCDLVSQSGSRGGCFGYSRHHYWYGPRRSLSDQGQPEQWSYPSIVIEHETKECLHVQAAMDVQVRLVFQSRFQTQRARRRSAASKVAPVASHLVASDVPESPRKLKAIFNQVMHGDFSLAGSVARSGLTSSIASRDLEQASIYLCALMNIYRLEGRFSAASKCYKNYEQSLAVYDLPPAYQKKLLKEHLVIAHEQCNRRDASEVIAKVNRIDSEGDLCPQEDMWLPGVILWRQAHLLQVGDAKDQDRALAMMRQSLEWYAQIDDSNTSGHAAAMLNAGWFYFVREKSPECLRYFDKAMVLAQHKSERTLLQARLGHAIASLALHEGDEQEVLLSGLNAFLGLDALPSVAKCHILLGKSTPQRLLVEEVMRRGRAGCSVFTEAILQAPNKPDRKQDSMLRLLMAELIPNNALD